MIERGKGYRYAFFSYVIFNVFFFVFDMGAEVQLPMGPLLICGVFVACAVHIVYCIFHEAYWGLNNNVKNYIILLIVATIINLVIGLVNGFGGEWFIEGNMNSSFYNLAVAIFLAVILVAMLVKYMKDKREVE